MTTATDADALHRQHILDACMQSIVRNPFGEFAARTMWAPASRGETLAHDIRRRLADALGDYACQQLPTTPAATSVLPTTVKRDVTQQQSEPSPVLLAPKGEPVSTAASVVLVPPIAADGGIVVKQEHGGEGAAAPASSSFQAALRAAKQRRAVGASTNKTDGSTDSKPLNPQVQRPVAVDTVVAAAPPREVNDEAVLQSTAASRDAAGGLSARPHQEIDFGDDNEDDDDETFDVFIPNEVMPPTKKARLESAGRNLERTSGGGADFASADHGANAASSETAAMAYKDPSMMTKDEFLQQFRRAPRRGEIGITAEQVVEAQALGYVMSGSRNRASNNYVDRIQRQLHERQAGQLRLNFLKESDRRAEEAALGFFLSLAQQSTTAEGEAR